MGTFFLKKKKAIREKCSLSALKLMVRNMKTQATASMQPFEVHITTFELKFCELSLAIVFSKTSSTSKLLKLYKIFPIYTSTLLRLFFLYLYSLVCAAKAAVKLRGQMMSIREPDWANKPALNSFDNNYRTRRGP